jgi:hypothetical protein
MLDVRSQQEAQKEAEERYKEHLKNMEDAAKESNAALVQRINDRYEAEVKVAEAASNDIIKAKEDELKRLDELTRDADRADEDAEQLDRIRRLQEQLNYEVSDANKYELAKQIADEQADYDKRMERRSIEDRKSAIQLEIEAEQAALAEYKEILQSKRDADIKAAENALTSYLENLETNVKLEDEQNEKSLEKTMKLNEDKLADAQKMYEKDYENAGINERNKAVLATTTMSSIVTMLYDKVSEFAKTGMAAGKAWADAFNEAASGVSEMLSGDGSTAFSVGTGFSSAAGINYNATNNFYVPTVTPSALAAANRKATRDLLEAIR